LSQPVFLLIFILVLSLFAFSAFTLAFPRFTRKHCLQTVGLKMRLATWNRLPIKKYYWWIQILHLCGG